MKEKWANQFPDDDFVNCLLKVALATLNYKEEAAITNIHKFAAILHPARRGLKSLANADQRALVSVKNFKFHIFL